MRTPRLAVLSLLTLFAAPLPADDLTCGTSSENDFAVRRLHERLQASRPRIEANASASVPSTLRNGAFYVEAGEDIVPGYNPFDLAQQSLVFEPKGGTTFAVRREALRYIEPAGEPVRDFQADPSALSRDLGFSFPIFGRDVTRVQVSAFNAVHLDDAVEQRATQVDVLEAAVQRGAVLSPLLITNRKPPRLAYARLYVDETPDGIAFTWRSDAGIAFGYDVQAELRRDGSVVYSYRTPRAMSWGAPILSPGFDPVTVPRQTLRTANDGAGDVASHIAFQVRPMVDIVRTDVTRIDGTDLVGVRVQVGQAIDPTKLASGELFRFIVIIDQDPSFVEIDRNGVRVLPAGGSRFIDNGASVRLESDGFELYTMQQSPNASRLGHVRVLSYVRPDARTADAQSLEVTFPPAPRRIATDLSAIAPGTELRAPITEAFVLGAFDPYAVYEHLQSKYALSDLDADAVAMFQSFYTDLIFYAGAYATGGNAQVDGIEPVSPDSGTGARRLPTLLHMNQLTYGHNAATQSASNVMMHELGHRWLYFFSIKEGGTATRSLNPVSAHPAGYVHTPAAFPVTSDPEQASVMGGGFFSPQPEGTYRARALNVGYSWTDLYLMGLAAPEEVQPWFYLADTNPPLAKEYWPVDNAVVTGNRREVGVQQIVDVHGPRIPTAAHSDKRFKVLFVLVTEPGRTPTEAEIAKLEEWRALLERNFALATGGRGSVSTGFVKPARKRAVR